MPVMNTGPWRVWMVTAGAAVGLTIAAEEAWRQPSFMGWLTAMGILTILLVVVVGYDQPGRYLFRSPLGWLLPLVGVIGIASVVRLPGLRWPHVSSQAMGALVVTIVVLAFVLVRLREPARPEVTGPLLFPLRSGRWAVAAGGVAALNHHLVSRAESGAVNLVALRADGSRASGISPRDVASYEAYGCQVSSPCDGEVVAALDGQPERVGVRGYGQHPGGNHVSIDNGTEIVHLAHLRPGSVRVAVGDRVVAGQPVGEVGSSGRTREPNLHLHAERGGEGLRLRFVDIAPERLGPGRTVQAPEDARRSRGVEASE